MNNLDQNTEKLAGLLSKLKIKRFYLTGAGNSLMSGYSRLFKTEPLFKRNTNLTAIFARHDIDIIVTHFSRTQNNNDEHIHHYFQSNISEKDMYEYNRIDNIKPDTPVINKTEKEEEKYYPKNPEHNYHFKDNVLNSEKDRANILVYIGGTGSFLDNVTRGGFPKILSGFKRDITSISAILKEIQSSNRNNETNTQVYLVGIPRYLNTPVTDIAINRHLKSLAKEYANVTYIEPINAKLFYGLKPDVHLNEEEYLELNNSIIESINDNYITVMAKIEIDRAGTGHRSGGVPPGGRQFRGTCRSDRPGAAFRGVQSLRRKRGRRAAVGLRKCSGGCRPGAGRKETGNFQPDVLHDCV